MFYLMMSKNMTSLARKGLKIRRSALSGTLSIDLPEKNTNKRLYLIDLVSH